MAYEIITEGHLSDGYSKKSRVVTDGKREQMKKYYYDRKEICESCDQQEDCWKRFSCRPSCYLKKPNACCPEDPPKWKPVLPKDCLPSKQKGDNDTEGHRT
jgi:hypothetical protein